MGTRIVIGLFESRGVVEDAFARLATLKVPESERAVVVLQATGAVPSTMAAEFDALSVDPLVWGNVRDSFATFIRNGETAVRVRARSDAESGRPPKP